MSVFAIDFVVRCRGVADDLLAKKGARSAPVQIGCAAKTPSSFLRLAACGISLDPLIRSVNVKDVFSDIQPIVIASETHPCLEAFSAIDAGIALR